MASAASTPETRQTTFESGVALALHLWSDLTFAVENNLGGSDGASKRDWFAGAVAELFPDLALPTTAIPSSNSTPAGPGQPTLDDLREDTESRLLQIMADEFDTIVDDGTADEVATQILGLWKECGKGQFAGVEALRRKWEAGKGKKVSAMFKEGKAEDQDTDWDTEDDDDEEDVDGDVEMGGAEAAAKRREEKPPPPEVDEDGFTKVTKKRR